MDLASKKIDLRLADLAVKKQKLEVTHDRDWEKECFIAEEHQMAARERILEKEQ